MNPQEQIKEMEKRIEEKMKSIIKDDEIQKMIGFSMTYEDGELRRIIRRVIRLTYKLALKQEKEFLEMLSQPQPMPEIDKRITQIKEALKEKK